MPAGLQLQKLLHEPEALAGLMERGGSVFRHPGAVGRYLQKLLLSRGVSAGSCLFLRQPGISAGIANHGLAA